MQVTTEGDAFIVAFHDPIDAIGWALHVQLALLEAPWPPELLQHDKGRVETCPEGKLLFRGLRVRVAINTGIPAEIIVSKPYLMCLSLSDMPVGIVYRCAQCEIQQSALPLLGIVGPMKAH